MQALGHRVQNIGRLVHPALLLPSKGKHFPLRLPETQGAISHGDAGIFRQTPGFEILKQLKPGQIALSFTVHHGQQLLGSVLGGTDHHQDAGPVGLETDVEVDAVHPHVGVALAAQIPLTPSAYSLSQTCLSRTMLAAERPDTLSPKWP